MPSAEPAPVIVTSSPLAREARQLLRRHYPDGLLLVWQQGSAPLLSGTLSTKLLSIATPLCISFYNDYIFSAEEIAAFSALVNIHPALPSIRGRGYDTLPILKQHCEYGATLHFVTKDIDSGPIIEVASRPMPQSVAYQEFRRMTQTLSLSMLENLLQRGRRIGLATLAGELRDRAIQSEWHWSGDRLTSPQLAVLLRNASRFQPQHPLFAQLPTHLLQLTGAGLIG